jgi:HEAT repeat protein
MAIKFHCPSPECGRALTVSDAAAGRAGKCPGCGSPLVVPHPEPEYETIPIDPEYLSEPLPASRVSAPRVSVKKAVDPYWDGVGATSGDGPVVSFDAVGLAWGLLTQRLGTWVLAVFVVGLAMFGCQFLLNLLAIFGSTAAAMVLPMPLPMITIVVAIVAGVMVQGVLVGGLYRMALKQIDGGDISVGDVFSVEPGAMALGVVMLLTTLGIWFGSLFLLIPGLIFAGLAMFALPAAVEGLGPIEAIGRSFGTLKRQWLMAPLFVVVLCLIYMVGVICLVVGVLVAAPLCVLSVAVQYRRSFAPACVTRKVVVADPWAEAVGQPARSGRVPGWAWGLLVLGAIVPMLMFVAVVAALVIPAARHAAQVAAQQNQQAQRGFQGGFPQPVRVPPVAVQPGPIDLVPEAIENASGGGDKRGQGVSMLYTLPVNPRHQAAVIAALTPLLSDPQLGGDAARGLDHWAGPGDVPILIAGLESDQPRVRFFLLQALGRLKAEAAIPALVEHLTVPEDRFKAADALRAIGPKAAPEVSKLLESTNPATRREASDLIKQLGGNDQATQMTVTLAALKSPDASERGRALQGLSKTPAVEGSRSDVLAAVEPLLKDPLPSTRRSALKVVETWGTAEQSPWLVAALDDPDRTVKAAALAAIRKLADPKAALELARRLTVDAQRKQAADALIAMKLKDEQVEAEVLQALESPNPDTRQSACQVLRVIGTEASIPALKKAATDKTPKVASAAKLALAIIDPSATPDASPDTPKSKMTPKKKR